MVESGEGTLKTFFSSFPPSFYSLITSLEARDIASAFRCLFLQVQRTEELQIIDSVDRSWTIDGKSILAQDDEWAAGYIKPSIFPAMWPSQLDYEVWHIATRLDHDYLLNGYTPSFFNSRSITSRCLCSTALDNGVRPSTSSKFISMSSFSSSDLTTLARPLYAAQKRAVRFDLGFMKLFSPFRLLQAFSPFSSHGTPSGRSGRGRLFVQAGLSANSLYRVRILQSRRSSFQYWYQSTLGTKSSTSLSPIWFLHLSIELAT